MTLPIVTTRAYSGIFGSSVEFLLARMILQSTEPISYFAVLPNEKEAFTFYTNVRFYLEFLAPKTHPPEELPIRFFPSHDVPFYEAISPDFFNTATRLKTLHDVLQMKTKCVVTSLAGLLTKTLPIDVFSSSILRLKKGDYVGRDRLVEELVELGYLREALVEDTGFFSLRGNLVDLFSPQYTDPIRIEFFGDEIESIRTFDLESQLSKGTLFETVDIIPAQEALLTSDQIDQFAASIKDLVDNLGFEKSERERLVGEIRERVLFPGVEQLLPAFYPSLSSLADYLRDNSTLVPVIPKKAALLSELEDLTEDINTSFANALDRGKPAFSPAVRFLSKVEVERLFEAALSISFELLNPKSDAIHVHGSDFQGLRDEVQRSLNRPSVFDPVRRAIETSLEHAPTVCLVFRSLSQAERLLDYLNENLSSVDLLRHTFSEGRFSVEDLVETKSRVLLVHGNLESGTLIETEGVCFISDRNIFGERTHRRTDTRFHGKDFVADFKELSVGDFIVHIDHGIGLFEGVRTLQIENEESEFLELKYSGGDTLYLPVGRLYKIQRYTAFRDQKPKLDRLGSTAWASKKARIREDILKIANDLLVLYAKRKTLSGFSFRSDTDELQHFEDSFAFEETPDQLEAVEEIIADMRDPKPMDRLVCGDVGYGKTEIAMRAAFNATLNSKQVCILAPTTILVQQHLQTFRDRFRNFPVRIEAVSRLIPLKQQKETFKGIASGAVDIAIGTHRLLGKEVHFHDLGLIIIDEEHRFGVIHKERLKKLKSQLDVLALTATPIPRTLQLAISGIRDLSIIATPPENRLAIKTYVSEFDDYTIREAILRETRRGGQIFFIHNRIQTIYKMETYLRELIPEIQIGVSHGQMSERELERVMLSFVNQSFQVLLTTTIVESGLDIPTANTMIINRADTFGLSELYQLRGRVGRSNRQAYCYLLIPPNQVISEDAQKRLKVIQSYTELGAGFKIATHDMEIRGAGNILGTQQSGHIAEIGFDLYNELLERTISELKGEPAPDFIEPEINIPVAAYIPEMYIPDTNLRIGLYKRISNARDDNELDDIKEEMRDRFGPLPEQTELLLKSIELKFLAVALRASAVDITRTGVTVFFTQSTPVRLQKLISQIQMQPDVYHLEQEGKLRIRFQERAQTPEAIITASHNALQIILRDMI